MCYCNLLNHNLEGFAEDFLHHINERFGVFDSKSIKKEIAVTSKCFVKPPDLIFRLPVVV